MRREVFIRLDIGLEWKFFLSYPSNDEILFGLFSDGVWKK
jgi:hypothetical protein